MLTDMYITVKIVLTTGCYADGMAYFGIRG